jgi:phosphocarrier protein
MSKKAVAEVTIINEKGLHARAASQFTKVASQYECKVVVRSGSVRANGKSIMNLLLLAAAQGTTLTIEVHGSGASRCLSELTELVSARFGEEL